MDVHLGAEYGRFLDRSAKINLGSLVSKASVTAPYRSVSQSSPKWDTFSEVGSPLRVHAFCVTAFSLGIRFPSHSR